MKGIVFTEFVEFMEGSFGVALADQVIEGSELASRGAFTAVATYDHRELAAMLRCLARLTERPPAELLRGFGRHLFGQLRRAYAPLFAGMSSTRMVLERLQEHIHSEVQKLYPEAELPSFQCDASRADRLVMTYRSSRGLADLALGMIEGCAQHFGESLEIGEQDLSGGARTYVRFTVNGAVRAPT